MRKHPPYISNCSISHVTRGAAICARYPKQQDDTAQVGDFGKMILDF